MLLNSERLLRKKNDTQINKTNAISDQINK
jgi:hypothetical protein